MQYELLPNELTFYEKDLQSIEWGEAESIL